MIATLEADHVYVTIPKQYRRFQPGTFFWPIGQAYEIIAAGHGVIDPRSAKEFAAFKKSTEARR